MTEKEGREDLTVAKRDGGSFGFEAKRREPFPATMAKPTLDDSYVGVVRCEE